MGGCGSKSVNPTRRRRGEGRGVGLLTFYRRSPVWPNKKAIVRHRSNSTCRSSEVRRPSQSPPTITYLRPYDGNNNNSNEKAYVFLFFNIFIRLRCLKSVWYCLWHLVVGGSSPLPQPITVSPTRRFDTAAASRWTFYNVIVVPARAHAAHDNYHDIIISAVRV